MKKFNLSSRAFDFANALFLILVAFVTLYPLWYMLIISLSNVAKVSTSNIYLWPVLPTLDSYKIVIRDSTLLNGYFISISRVACGVFSCLFCNGMMAYALSRRYFPLRKALNSMVVITMFISGGLIPFYLVVNAMGLINSFWALFVPFAFDSFGIILIKNYFKTIPESLDESAKLDGAGDFRIFLQLYLPLSMPILATMSLFWAVYFWNDFIWGGFLVVNPKLLPIQTVLYRIIMQSGNAALMSISRGKNPNIGANVESIKAATIILTTAPILLVYPFLQKYFVKGINLGAVKE